MLGVGAERAKATTICGTYKFIKGFDLNFSTAVGT